MSENKEIMTEKEKYFDYINDQINNHGLIGAHITTGRQVEDFQWLVDGKPIPKREPIDEEEFYGELNRMIAAPDIPDPEIF